MTWAAFILAALLSGSIPFGLLIARARGLDIRAHGSGNIGATNVGRTLGLKWGALCFALDFLKGFLPTLVCGLWANLIGDWAPADGPASLWLLVLGASILGHIYSPWVRFKGGKGVATSLGAMLAFYPILTLPAAGAIGVWAASLRAWGYVSLASIFAAASIPLSVIAFPLAVRAAGLAARPAAISWPALGASAALAALVIYRHRANIARLRRGTEPRIRRA